MKALKTMRYFPLFFDTKCKTALVAGGGETALQKVRLLLKSEFHIIVMATKICDELQIYRNEKRIVHKAVVYDEELAKSADFVFAATPCAGINGLFLHAKPDITVNVVDKPALGNAIMPAIVDRDPVIVAIGSEGTAPVLARSIKSLNEQLLEHDIGQFAQLCEKLRAKVSRYIEPAKRRSFWQWVIQDAPRNLWRQKYYKRAETLMEKTVLDYSHQPKQRKLLSIIVTCKEADMMPVKAVQRLQNADMIFHEDHIESAVFEYARRDAERISVDRNFLCKGPDDQTRSSASNMVLLTKRKVALLESTSDLHFFQDVDFEFIPCTCNQKPIYKNAQNGE